MAVIPTVLFFKRPNRYGIEGQNHFLFFDLNIGERHSRSAKATMYNVEDGSIIADHIQNELESGSLTGYITNYSLSQPNGIITNRAQDAFDTLEQLWKDRQPVTLYTLLKKYENVVLSFNFDKNNSKEDLTIDIAFQKINIVKLQEISAVGYIKIKTNNTNSKETNPLVNIGRISP